MYSEKNADEVKRKKREYYQKNRERILNNVKEYYKKTYVPTYIKPSDSIECECGGRYTKSHKSRHLKQKIHLDYINNL